MRSVWSILIAILLVTTSAALAGPAGLVTTDQDRDPHPPIRITEDQGPEGFILGHDPTTGEPMYRPGSGVVAGHGTADSPFVLTGWSISPSHPASDGSTSTAAAGILIRDTRAHVVVQDNRVDGLDVQPDGLRLRNTTNVTVAGNVLVHNTDEGLDARGSDALSVRGNTLAHNGAAILVQRSDQVELTANTVDDNGVGIALDRAHGARVDNTTLSDNRAGIEVTSSRGVQLVDNVLIGNQNGLLTGWSPKLHVEGNTIQDSRYEGVRLYTSWNATVSHNDVSENGRHGLVADRSHETQVANNTLINNGGGGAIVRASINVSVVDNDLYGNAWAGLSVDGGSTPVNATDNWWGAVSGPSGGVTDACNGATATGTGDEIDAVNGGAACFMPWRTSPNPNAGPAP